MKATQELIKIIGTMSDQEAESLLKQLNTLPNTIHTKYVLAALSNAKNKDYLHTNKETVSYICGYLGINFDKI